MSANPDLLDSSIRCQCGDAAILPIDFIRLSGEGLRWQIDQASRQSRSTPAVVLGSFGALALLTLLFAVEVRTIPMLTFFAGMVAWTGMVYGLSGQRQWQRVRSAHRLRAGRMNAWLAMWRRCVRSGWHTVEHRRRVALNRLAVVLSHLRARLHIRLGLTDFNLTAFRLVPPEFAHA
ncbi:hypothetical protein [Burkholderia cenocepacia]|uniref:hypothetical protein n=1 Tax=Burkholderia cenocepacia TaxID=95486 RepID=UPI000D0C144F|nr:hypothetical protein [Burkholderia cenocepacia]SOT40219.1 conserved hypothetical protein [Burkholderia cenocepacia]